MGDCLHDLCISRGSTGHLDGGQGWPSAIATCEGSRGGGSEFSIALSPHTSGQVEGPVAARAVGSARHDSATRPGGRQVPDHSRRHCNADCRPCRYRVGTGSLSGQLRKGIRSSLPRCSRRSALVRVVNTSNHGLTLVSHPPTATRNARPAAADACPSSRRMRPPFGTCPPSSYSASVPLT